MKNLSNCRGFTLLEILVVLALLGFAYAMVPPLFSSSGSTIELKAAARQLAAGLRKAQTHAILAKTEAALSVDVEARQFQLTGDAKRYPLPKDAQISVFTAQSEVAEDKVGAIRFFPDGSSTGGRISVASGDRKFMVDVDWLTGRVSIQGGQ